MKNNLFNYKIMRDFFIGFTIFLLLFYFYIYFSNTLLFHTVMGYSMMTVGIIGPTVGFIVSFRLKPNIFTKVSPAVFVYTILMFIHLLSLPGVGILINTGPSFTVYSLLSANIILSVGILIAVIHRKNSYNNLANLLVTFFVGAIMYIINYTVDLPVLIVNDTPTLFMRMLSIFAIVCLLVAIVIWFLDKKQSKDKNLKLFGIILIILAISEVLYLFHFENISILLYFGSSIRYIALMLIMYMIFKVNLILPYNDLFQSIVKENEAQRKLKEEIGKSYQRLSRSQEIGHVGTWELNLEENTIWASDEAFRIYGIPNDGNNLVSLKTVQKVVFKEDREMLTRALKNLINNNQVYNVVFRIKNPKGVVHHINSVANLEYKNNKPHMVYGVINDITDLHNEQQKLRYASYHDHLTNVFNRRYFVEQRELVNLRKDSLPIATVILDINGLKIINDSFGHNVGNKVLKKIADILMETVSDKGFVSRIGGDEFAIICPKTNKEQIEDIMSIITDRINKEKVANINLSLAYGIAIKNDFSQILEKVLKTAEDDMYLNKISNSQSVRNKIIDALLKTLYEKDAGSEEHSQRVSIYSYKLAIAAGISEKKTSDVKLTGLLHDIGKVTISNDILNKAGKLSNEEYDIIKTHSKKGYSIIHSIGDMDRIASYVLEHHEYYNGKGYPKGLKGEDISYEARIISIADAYDAMTSFRTYKKEKTKDEAIKELIACKGKQFDPELIDIFIEKVLKVED